MQYCIILWGEELLMSTENYALCDNCKKEMTADTGCHSFWWCGKENIITICNDCSLEVLSE